jgi:hypothetical protein
MTALGVPDMIGSGTAALPELSERAGVEPRFLSTYYNNYMGRECCDDEVSRMQVFR